MSYTWKATFKLESGDDARNFQEFLDHNLRPPNKASTSGSMIVIESPSEDECFAVAHWAKNRNPVGPLLYSVKGFDEQQRVVFDSGCPVCRKEKQAGKERIPHWEHRASRERRRTSAPIVAAGQRSIERELLSTVKVGSQGRIRLSPRVLKKLSVKKGQTVAFWFEAGRLYLQKEE